MSSMSSTATRSAGSAARNFWRSGGRSHDMDAAALIRTSLIFFVGGLLLTTAAISAFMLGDMVWRHCLHDDPRQTCGGALFFAVAVPFYAIVLAMGLNFLPLFVGAVLAVVGRRIFGRVPL